MIRKTSKSFCSTHYKNNLISSNSLNTVVAPAVNPIAVSSINSIPSNSLREIDVPTMNSVKQITTPSNYQKIKIKKLKFNQHYLYVGSLDSKKIILRSFDPFFYCRIPKYMIRSNYVDNYLVRSSSSKLTEWKKK